jgi:hypothetical protein
MPNREGQECPALHVLPPAIGRGIPETICLTKAERH